MPRFKFRREPPVPRCLAVLLPRVRFSSLVRSRRVPLFPPPPPSPSEDPSLAAAIGDLSEFYPPPDLVASIRAACPSYRPATGTDRARNFLSEFLLCSHLLESALRVSRIVVPGAPPRSDPFLADQLSFWRSRCRSVEALVASLPASREKILLTFHYLHGLPIEVCAERLYVSRRTAYRIHRRALSLASHALDRHWQRTGRR